MSKPDTQAIALQLESSNSKDRLLALASLREVTPEEAVPLIKKVLYDEMLPVRSMAVFALGVKQTEECFPILVDLLANDADYGIRADAAGALGYLEDIRLWAIWAIFGLNRCYYRLSIVTKRLFNRPLLLPLGKSKQWKPSRSF